MPMSREAAIAELEKVYSRIPNVHCQKKCWQFCGPIGMTGLEWKRIGEARGGDVPVLKTCLCPMLDPKTKTCTQYALRPYVCRIYGAVKAMQCPYGCKPDRFLTELESYEIFEEIQCISLLAGEVEVVRDLMRSDVLGTMVALRQLLEGMLEEGEA